MIHTNNNLKQYIIRYLLCLIPLYLYGFYKNGLLLYLNNYISFINIFKLFYILIISIVIYILIHILLKKKISCNYLLLSIFIIPLFIPINTNILVYILLFSLYLFISLKLPSYFPYMIYLILILSILYPFANLMENSNSYVFTTLDIFLGRGISGIGISNIVLLLVISIILYFTNIYKENIVLSSLLVFIILSILFKEYTYLLNANTYACILILGSLPRYSIIDKHFQYIYGVIMGILIFIFMKYLNIYCGAYLSLAFVSSVYNVVVLFYKKNIVV